jgi:cytidylate kinase
MAIITISREFGSSCKQIGQVLASQLGYEYVDRSKIHQEIGLLGKQWQNLEEELDGLNPTMWERYDWSFQAFVALSQSIILNFGVQDRVILIGRGGNFLFKGIPHALRIRIAMPRQTRIERVMNELDLPRKKARWLIEKIDKDMAGAVYTIYGKQWDDPSEYDMTFDLRKTRGEEIIKKITKAVAQKEKKNTEKARAILRIRAVAAKVKAGIATNPHFLIPTFDVEAGARGIILHGIVHSPTEHEEVEKLAQKLAEDVSLKSELHYRGLASG